MNCTCCGKIIESHHVRLGNICMGCEGAEIEVYRVAYCGNSYVDRELGNISDMLGDMSVGEYYKISKEKMLFAEYINLPEFTGF